MAALSSTRLSASRALPVAQAEAFDRLMPMPLADLLHRRFGPIPPVRGTREQPATWDTVGQSRRILLADGGTMLEELTTLDRPQAFGYTLTELTGPLKPLAATIDGLWTVEESGTGCRVTWAWTIHPRGRLGALAMPVFSRFWHGYARQCLEELERLLLR